ncbi:MAG: sigma 54-interacting transcriptional regulator [Myxococcales bacterium]|nr:sigma 54-interacting transcriptional regulator [Myxococcales bacterium]
MARIGTDPRARLESLLGAARWADAEALLSELTARDAGGDVALLAAWRRLEDGRGARSRTVAHVAAFLERFPGRGGDPYFLLERGLAHRASGDLDAARRDLVLAIDRLPKADGDARALGLSGLGTTYFSPFDARRARQAFLAARRVAEASEAWSRVAEAEINLGIVHIQAGAIAKAARAYRRAMAHALTADDGRLVVMASYNLGNCLHDLGKNVSARRALTRALTLAEERGDRSFVAWSTLLLGHLDRKAGARDAARARYRQAASIFADLGDTPTSRAWVAFHEGELLVEEGALEEAEAITLAAASAPATDGTARLACELVAATAKLARGRRRAAAELADRVARDAEAGGLVEIAWRARTVATRARAERAARRWLEGRALAPPEGLVDALSRAEALVEGAMRGLSTQGRRLYLRDRTRAADAAWLAEARAMGAPATRRAPDADARATWLRVLGHLSDLGAEASSERVAAIGLDAILSAASARAARIVVTDGTGGAIADVARDPWGRPASTVDGERVPLPPSGTVTGELTLAGEVDGPEVDLARLVGGLVLTQIAALRARDALRAEGSRSREENARLEVELLRAEAALGDARGRLPEPAARGGMLGASPPMQALFARIDRVARSDLSVLVLGESGTGKELVARALHDQGARAARPFVAVNCAAIPESLLESALFGHRRGAFTGADRDEPGLFVVADTGTLFLDEVAEMSLPMQARLLRVLQDGEVRAVGGTAVRSVDVRVVAATHQDLHGLVQRGRFREDLLYRLDVVSIQVPPLRARGDDVVLLARAFLAAAAPRKRLAPDAVRWLLAAPFPGNVRELRAVVEAAAVLCDADVIARRDLEAEGRGSRRAPRSAGSLDLAELEAWAIEQALAREPSAAAAARALGIGRATLYRKLEALRLAPPRRTARRR